MATSPYISQIINSFGAIAPQISNGTYTGGSSVGAYNPSAYTVNTGLAASNPDQASADLVNKQNAYFQARGKPLETAAIGDITNPNMPRTIADRAGAGARSAFDATRGMEERQLRRFGVRISPDKQRSINRNFGLERALVDVGARNQAFGATEDAQVQLGGDALQIGRGIAGQATQGLSTAGSLATARQSAARQAADAQSASRIGSMASGAGLGAAVGLTAGIGTLAAGSLGAAAAGGGIGAGIGLLAALI
jgi:hypothetical protein